MSVVTDKIAEVNQAFHVALDAAATKISEDINELKRLIESGSDPTETLAALDAFKADVETSLGAIDPVPEFPPTPAPPSEG
jgi:hypothetical protein